MAIRNIVKVGDDILTRKCRPVTDFNDRLFTLLDDMHDTLTDAHGAGLAAPQVGILRRLALVMVEDESFLEIINPEIIAREGEQDGAEGCLSVPGRRGTVERPEKVRVQAQDRFGQPIEIEGEGFLDMALCHEIDHLDGIIYIDKMIEDVTDQYETEDEE